LRAAQQNVKQSLPVPSTRETVGVFLERWLADVAPNRVRRTTLARYTLDVRRHLLPELGRLKFHELTPQRLQALISQLAASGLGPRSIAHSRAVLRVALSQAQKEGLVGQNVAKLVTTPRAKAKPVPPLAPADAKALLEAFAGHVLEPLIITALA